MTDTKKPDTSNTVPSDLNDMRTARQLLETLVCPVTRTTLSYDAQSQELISQAAGLAFPIRDGIPIMLADEARELDT